MGNKFLIAIKEHWIMVSIEVYPGINFIKSFLSICMVMPLDKEHQ